MAEPKTVPRKITSIWPPLLLLVLSLAYAGWAQNYGQVARLMPTITGVFTALLAVLDLLSRLDNGLGKGLRVALGADFRNREMSHDPAFTRELAVVAWMVGCIVSLALIGFLPTVPLFILAYMRFWGGRPWIASALSGVAVLIFVTLVFEVILDYGLYRGLLFGGRW